MRVLKDNYTNSNANTKKTQNNPYPRKMLCEHCRSELEYEKSDLRMGFLGCYHLDCPLCGRENMIDCHEDNITLTKGNVEFPVHFWHTSVETGAANSCNNENVRECINKAIQYFRENKNEYSWQTCYGNLYIAVYRYEGDKNYWVVVSNNYYDTYIDFEAEDCPSYMGVLEEF